MSNMAYFWTIVLIISSGAFVIIELTVMIGAAFDIRSLGQDDAPPEVDTPDSANTESP